ncbi:unnamed protein product [Litomosoides sigmodontis]|uniref:Uncharacterized protein n=1 Tax=Litomosoides sigmodontis TaxID=42156 RepID=A0A3P7K5L1_LITSI|nr:unnamed protein product [Litomosoides sigmodontis]
MAKSFEMVMITVMMTLLPLIFLAPMAIFELLERKRQKMFQFLLEFRPKNFVFPESSTSEDQFKNEKQLSENISRSREAIRAILSVRNHLSARELLSLMCTSPTQQSSSCILQRNSAEKIGRHQTGISIDGADTHSISGTYSSSTGVERLNIGVKQPNPISILRGRVNDEHDDADNDGDVDDARGRIRDDRDDDNDAMGCSSRRPTSRTLSLISPKQPATTLQ